MCAAIGAGVNTTDFSKQIVIAVTNNIIHAYLIFAASVLYGESIPITTDTPLQEVLEAQIARLEATIKDDPPSHFKNLNLKEEEYNQIVNGWHSPCVEVLHLIGLPSAVTSVDSFIRGHRIVSGRGLDECITSGLNEVVKGVSQLPTGTRVGGRA